jgi:RNA polymerase sigma-70 factor (ECF subfamily)
MQVVLVIGRQSPGEDAVEACMLEHALAPGRHVRGQCGPWITIGRRLCHDLFARPGGRVLPRARGKRCAGRVANASMDLSTPEQPGPACRPAYARAVARPELSPRERLDRRDAHAWVDALRPEAADRQRAIAELHELLLRGARFELNRRRASLSHLPYAELDDLANQAADDALVAIIAKLDTFRGASRFTTWAYKFVLLEAGVKARRRVWHGREVSLDDHEWLAARDTGAPAQELLERGELLDAIAGAVRSALTPHQREVFAALALNGVPIDVLAERLGTTRGALYKTLHDARRKLRATLAATGFEVETTTALEGSAND